MATPGEQVAQAVQSGGVRRMADSQPGMNENAQLANFLGKIIQKSAKAAPGRSTDPIEEGVAGRVPEPVTEGVIPEGTTKLRRRKTETDDQYKKRVKTAILQKTQQRLAQDALSEEGRQRFMDAGGEAGQAIQTPTQRELDELGEDTLAPTDLTELTPNEQVAQTAEKARRGFSTGLADEGDADDLITMITQPGMVDDAVGIDFNFDKFDGGEDINRVINATSEIISKPTEAQKRGIRTNDQTLAAADQLLADEMGLTKKALRLRAGETLNAEQMTAVRILLQRSAARLKSMAEEIQAGKGSPQLLVDFRRQMSIHAGIQMKAKGAQTEIARALQAFKIPAGTTVPDEALTALLNESGGSKLAKKMAAGYLDALKEGGQGKANKYVFGAWGQKIEGIWMEVYINGLLSYFPTHIKNALATPLFMSYNIMADLSGAAIGASIRSGQRMMGMQPTPDGVHFEDVFARIAGYNQSFRDAWAVAAKTFREETPADQLNKIESANFRAIDSENLDPAVQFLSNKFGMSPNTIGRAIDHLGRVIRLPGRALMGADDFWRVIASRGELYEQAVRTARRSKAGGRTDQEALDDAMMIILDPKFSNEQMDHASRYVTLTDDLGDGLLGGGTNKLRQSFLGKLLIPFAKAPTNAMRRVGENHPFIALASMFNPQSTLRNNLLGNNGARAQQRAMGRLALGSATMYQLNQIAQEGRITGSMPKDEQIRKMLPPGWQPYSLVFRGEGWPNDEDGDPLPIYDERGVPNGKLKYISYQGLEPVSALLGIAASTAQYQTMFVDPEDKLNFFTGGVVATVDYFRDLPMLQGIGDVFAAFTYDDPSIVFDGFLGGTAGVLPMPFSSVVRNVDRLETTAKRTVENPVQYYTIDDVNRMYEEAKNTDNPYPDVPFSLVGTPKNITDVPGAQFFYDTVTYGWNQQMMNTPYVNDQIENYAYQYDMLGNQKERGVPFSVNPMLAMWNSVTPFKMSLGDDIELYHKELIRLGAPLSETKKSISGVKLDKINQGKLTKIAKNDVILPLVIQSENRTTTIPGQYAFRDYLKVLTMQPQYYAADDDMKVRMIQNAEQRFYKAALPRLLAMDGNEELSRIFYERGIIKQRGYIK